MKEILITSIDNDIVLEQLSSYLGGEIVHEKWGENFLSFNNEHGKGTIRCIAFDWGVSLIDYDVFFYDDVKMIFNTNDDPPVEFIFVSDGTIEYSQNGDEFVTFDRYQNIIVSSKKSSTREFIFPQRVNVKVNFIQISKKKYVKKEHHNLDYLDDLLVGIFKDHDVENSFRHIGNYSLKIADQVKQLNIDDEKGIIRTLGIEGQLNLIMALQLIEHRNYKEQQYLPEAISKQDIKKIHQLTEYIVDNVSNPLSVSLLAERAGMHTKKLQLGFRVLYSKSVNEYIRQIKLEISRDYLKNTNLNVSEIVYTIGFKSRSYFSKIFYLRYGILPTDYRKSLIKKSNLN